MGGRDELQVPELTGRVAQAGKDAVTTIADLVYDAIIIEDKEKALQRMEILKTYTENLEKHLKALE